MTASHPYSPILAGLEARLTGNPAVDKPLLLGACAEHRDAPWAREFVKVVCRLMIDRGIMTQADLNELGNVGRREAERLEQLHREAAGFMQRGQLDKAAEAATLLLRGLAIGG